MIETRTYSAMLYDLAESLRREGCIIGLADRVDGAAERLDTLTVTIRGMEIMLSELQANFNRAISKVEAATAAHPNAVRFLLDEAIEIWGQAIAYGKPENQAVCGKCNSPDLCREYGRACDPYEDDTVTTVPAIVSYPTGSLGEAIEIEGGAA